MEITADQFVTCRSRRVLTDDGQQGMDGKPGTEPHVTAAYLMRSKTLPWWTGHGMGFFPPGSLIVSDAGMA